MLYVWATDKAAGTIVDSLFLSSVVLFVFSLKERKKMSRTKLSLSLFFFRSLVLDAQLLSEWKSTKNL